MRLSLYFVVLLLGLTVCGARKDKVELGGDPTYHRHRTRRSAPMIQTMDPEMRLQQSFESNVLPAAQSTQGSSSVAGSVNAANPASSSSSSTADRASTSSSTPNVPEEQEGLGDSRTRLDSTGEVGIGEFKDGHEKVKTYQMSLLDKVTAAAGDFFAADIDAIDKNAFVEYLKNSITLTDDEARTLGIAVDAYLEMHDEHKRVITEGDVASKMKAGGGENSGTMSVATTVQQAQADWAQTQAKAATVSVPTMKLLRFR